MPPFYFDAYEHNQGSTYSQARQYPLEHSQVYDKVIRTELCSINPALDRTKLVDLPEWPWKDLWKKERAGVFWSEETIELEEAALVRWMGLARRSSGEALDSGRSGIANSGHPGCSLVVMRQLCNEASRSTLESFMLVGICLRGWQRSAMNKAMRKKNGEISSARARTLDDAAVRLSFIHVA